MINILSIFVSAVEVSDSVASITPTAKDAIAALSGYTIPEILEIVTKSCISFCIKLVEVSILWFVGRWITKRLLNFAKMIMQKRKTNETVQSFLTSLIDVVLLITLVVMVISIFGIDTSSFIALFASAGVAIGMALSGTLQNFAGGVMILLFRPYKVGDFIEAQGQSGVVKEIQIFNTVLKTGDNKIILVPNGPMSTGIVNNYSREELRRVDFSFSISYGDDYEKAKAVIEELVAADARILKSPKHFIGLSSLGASSINIVLRVWAKQEDYWGIYYDMNKNIYETLPKRGLNFPYQTFTINVNQEKQG
ncbi:MAG: mechanosensitive ion channel [Bacteroidaceae bacterium]|nr:mechanosensitive ion channel [Bacteroidaceae bacterium]